MKRDSRLSGVLHILLHMAEQDELVTSEMLAKSLQTNPVVVRRIMAGLRDAGYVRSEKGHRGGWRLVSKPSALSLRDIYDALGSPTLLAIGNRTESPGCLVEEAVNAALNRSFAEAERTFLTRISEVTLATLSVDVRARAAAREAKAHEMNTTATATEKRAPRGKASVRVGKSLTRTKS